ncbi:MAG: ABC transporter permease [Anaerolineae bacterium]|jgi:ABC-2 type transport system permease protein|nr:ABC transporter permease [Anaerolineae bacterium]MBT7072055.1 ABC transporter permease [Anaerolineae bacterium]MBT7326679.1 ABC transporter permease [Anaerolineae bacterium]
MFRRILALVKKEFIHLRNDWWLPAFMLFGGVLELMLVGWATSRPINNLPLMVLDHDRSAASRALVISLENTETFALEAMVDDFQTIEDALERGEISAAIIIPPDYAEEMAAANGTPSLSMILNGAESIPATAALHAAEGVAATLNEELIIKRLKLSPDEFSGFAPRLRVWFNEALSEALYTTPAEMGLMLEFTTLLFAALAFSREKELGTLEQLLVMPFSSLEIIIGKAIPVIVIAFTDFLLMLGMVHFAFDVPIRGSLPLLFILAFGYLLVELGKGMVLSVIAKTQMQAFLLVLLFGMTDFMFTGYAAPVESMPKALQFFANIVPAHHWLEILRGILLKGAGMDVLWPHVLALAILGTIIMTFSLRFVRRALD